MANGHSTSIQNTTKSVHAETIRVVEEQTKDLDVKMRDLDDFVTRARSENGKHLQQHAKAVDEYDRTVKGTVSFIDTGCKKALVRVNDIHAEVELGADQLYETISPLGETVVGRLSSLRRDISNTVLREYEPTGETPEKVRYRYHTELPRTEPHEMLIAGLTDAPTPTEPAPVVFSDLDTAEPASSPPGLRRRPVPPPPPLLTPGLDVARDPLSMSLREVNPNLTTGSIAFDASASTLSLQADNTMPLFRRSTRQPKKQAVKGRGAVAAMEGRENVPPSAFTQSLSRRKSPRLR